MRPSCHAKAEATRDKILEAASDLLLKHGYYGVSIGDIMAAAGLTVGGYYNHFESKEALAVEACQRAFGKEVRRWESVLNDSSGRLSASQKLARWYVAETDSDCPIVAFNQDAAVAQNAALSEAYTQGTRLLLDVLLDGCDSSAANAPGRDQVLLLFVALIGTRFLGRFAPTEAWVKDIQKTVLRGQCHLVGTSATDESKPAS